jgi:hypothetical protein
MDLDIAFPTVVHHPWKSLRDSHIPTAPTMPAKTDQKTKERSPADPLTRVQSFRPPLGLENASVVWF